MNSNWYLQEGQDRGPRKLQNDQPHLSPWEGDGATTLEIISKHMENKKIIRSIQHEFTKGKPGLTNLDQLL